MYLLNFEENFMKLSETDFLVISSIVNASLAEYDKRFRKIEKMLKRISKAPELDVGDMTYDELAKNIVKLTGEEFYTRDFNITEMK
jgi:enoyl reductase-like protein